jgi:hypothetical protein
MPGGTKELMINRRKRAGDIGPTRVTSGSIEWQKIDFPSDKKNIELSFAQRFVATYNLLFPLWSGLTITDLVPNRENSLDFRLKTTLGEKWLELMAIRPIEFFRVPPEQAPPDYNAYDLAKFIHGKIMEKSRKYRSQKPGKLFLLLYLDDWRFQPSTTMKVLLQYWCNRKVHSFEAIFYYLPLDANEGHLSPIAPTPSEHWKNFDPENYRQSAVINFDPSKWRQLPPT